MKPSPMSKILLPLMVLLCVATHGNANTAVVHGNRFLGGSTDDARDKAMGLVTRAFAQELTRRIELPMAEVNCPFVRCITSLFNGSVDFVFLLSVKDERRAGMDFVQVWPGNIKVIFMLPSGRGHTIQSYDDLLGKRLGVVRGYAYFSKLDSDTRINREVVVAPQQLPKLLKAGRIDAFASYGHLEQDILARYPGFESAPFSGRYGELGFLAVSKKSPLQERLPELNKAVLEMIKDGTLDAILDMYLPGERLPYPPELGPER